MQIKNNNIHITRGETSAVTVKCWNSDGTPLILPPTNRRLRALAAITECQKYGDETEYIFRVPFVIKPNTTIPNTTIQLATKAAESTVQIWGILDNGYELPMTGHTRNHELTVLLPYNAITKIVVTNTTLTYIDYDISDYMSELYTTPGKSLISVLAFTVRAADTDDIVLEKYLNLHSSVMYRGKSDHMRYGWNKFDSYDIIDASTVTELKQRLIDEAEKSINHVGKVGDDYFQLIMDLDGAYELIPYEFVLGIPLLWQDTQNLQSGEYLYDIIVYQGYVKDTSSFDKDEFPFEQVHWKKEIVSPHKFIIEESNNA